MAHATHSELLHEIHIPAGDVQLDGDLVIPDAAHGIVLFAHGSGSSRFSGRNRYVAEQLRDTGLATLLMDLLTGQEEQADRLTAQLRFDIDLLAQRLVAAVRLLNVNLPTMDLPIGLFGASTGGGAALVAAAREPELVQAVVSRGGRPDLAGDALPLVRCPVLLIVGGDDAPVIEMNRDAMRQMRSEVQLEIIPRATHLFEEPGTLESVARLARDFFGRHLRPGPPKIMLDGLDPPRKTPSRRAPFA
jgi:putative phosphoribosyl transferase